MRRVALAVVLGACGGDEGRNIVVSSDVAGLDQLSITVLEPSHSVVNDRRLPARPAPLELPDHFVLDEADRTGPARLLVWGLAGGQRVAFGAAAFTLRDTATVELQLAAPPPDCDDDGIPDPEDGCPELADPEQDDPDGDGVTSACASYACPGNLVADPGFETSLAGWSAVNGTASWIDAGRGRGRKAARVCKTSDTYVNFKNAALLPTLVAGSQVVMRGFVRAAPGMPTPADVRAQFQTSSRQVPGIPVVLGACWQPVSTMATIGAADTGPGAVGVASGGGQPDGICYDVDDVCVQVTAP